MPVALFVTGDGVGFYESAARQKLVTALVAAASLRLLIVKGCLFVRVSQGVVWRWDSWGLR